MVLKPWVKARMSLVKGPSSLKNVPPGLSNVILLLSLLAQSILVVLCYLEAAIVAASMKNGGTIPIKVLKKTPHTLKLDIAV